MGKAAYERGSRAISRQIDDEYNRNPHAQASAVIAGLENQIDVLRSGIERQDRQLSEAHEVIDSQAARIKELEGSLEQSERKAQRNHDEYMRWFRAFEGIREKWVIQSKVIRTALTPDEYRLARDIVEEYDGV